MGHGPSILESDKGIDDRGFVVRQKSLEPMKRNPEKFGERIDAVVGSLNQLSGMLKGRPSRWDSYEIWVFTDSRFPNISEAMMKSIEITENIKCPVDLCRQWDAMYLGLRTPFEFDGPFKKHPVASDELGHRHLSSGLHALIMLCDLKHPKHIDLVGFDNVANGEFTWSVTRGEDWQSYPDHRWDVEHFMIPMIEERFDTEINFV